MRLSSCNVDNGYVRHAAPARDGRSCVLLKTKQGSTLVWGQVKESVLMFLVIVLMVATKAVEGRRQEQSEHLADSKMPTSNR